MATEFRGFCFRSAVRPAVEPKSRRTPRDRCLHISLLITGRPDTGRPLLPTRRHRSIRKKKEAKSDFGASACFQRKADRWSYASNLSQFGSAAPARGEFSGRYLDVFYA